MCDIAYARLAAMADQADRDDAISGNEPHNRADLDASLEEEVAETNVTELATWVAVANASMT